MWKVLVCEADPVYAAGLRRLLERDGDITATAMYTTPAAAVTALPRVQPDVVVLDLADSGMAGMAAIEDIMGSHPLPILVLSGADPLGRGNAAAALAAGALDVLEKETLDLDDTRGTAADAFRRRVRLLSRSPVIRHPRANLRDAFRDHGGARPVSAIGICGSAGGPNVLARLLGGLPASYPVPILVVQHISAGFTEGLAQWLDSTVPLPVGIAGDGAPASAGAWIAPEGAHLTLTRTGRLSLDKDMGALEGRHQPSGDILFESIAAVAGSAAVAIVLSGIGRDGVAGTVAVRRRGGLAIAQDRRSSMVFGMPQAAIASGVDLVLTPDEIAVFLSRMRHEPLRGRPGQPRTSPGDAA
jgi:two-component system, chemotaxis family, protein-glutamate methylesterase/glutaminase